MASRTVGFAGFGGHGRVTTVSASDIYGLASNFGGVGFHTIARVGPPTGTETSEEAERRDARGVGHRTSSID